MDRDGDGRIDLNEWVHGDVEQRLGTDQNMIRKEFERILSTSKLQMVDEKEKEKDGDDEKAETVKRAQTISTEDVRKSFGNLVNAEELEDIIAEIDENGDGVIDLAEFQHAMEQ